MVSGKEDHRLAASAIRKMGRSGWTAIGYVCLRIKGFQHSVRCANNSSANHSKSLASPPETGQIDVSPISNAIEASVLHAMPLDVSRQSISKRICGNFAKLMSDLGLDMFLHPVFKIVEAVFVPRHGPQLLHEVLREPTMIRESMVGRACIGRPCFIDS